MLQFVCFAIYSKGHLKGIVSLSDVVLGFLKWGAKDSNCHFSVEDADWATSDKPIVITSDGCVRVYDSELKTCHSVLNVLDVRGEGGGRGIHSRVPHHKLLLPTHSLQSPCSVRM